MIKGKKSEISSLTCHLFLSKATQWNKNKFLAEIIYGNVDISCLHSLRTPCTTFLKLWSGVLSCCLKFSIPVAFNFDCNILKSEMIESPRVSFNCYSLFTSQPCCSSKLILCILINITRYTLYNCSPCDNVHFHLQTTEDKTIVKVNTDISHSVYFENDKYIVKMMHAPKGPLIGE